MCSIVAWSSDSRSAPAADRPLRGTARRRSSPDRATARRRRARRRSRAPPGWWRSPRGSGTRPSSASITSAALSTTCSQLSITSSVSLAGQHRRHRRERVGHRSDAHRERDRVGDVVGIGHARQFDEPDVVEPRQQVGRRLHGEPRLADPADPGERHDAVRARTSSTTRADVTLATDERRTLDRQVVRERVDAANRREVRTRRSGWVSCHTCSGSVRSRSRWVPRSTRSTGSVPTGRRARAPRPPPTSGSDRRGRPHDPRRPVDGPPTEVVAHLLDLARVDAHPHRRDRWTASRAGRRSPPVHGRLGRRERGRDAVTHRREHLAARSRRPPRASTPKCCSTRPCISVDSSH